jgi:hypothetical protein
MGATYAWQSSLTRNICQLSPLTGEKHLHQSHLSIYFGPVGLKTLCNFRLCEITGAKEHVRGHVMIFYLVYTLL